MGLAKGTKAAKECRHSFLRRLRFLRETTSVFTRHGFTLIELLAVIAIIGVLAAIIVPTVSGARTAANKAKTRVQFSQWAVAMNNSPGIRRLSRFLSAESRHPIGTSNAPSAEHLFHDVLAGRRRDGSVLPAGVAGPPSDAASPKRKTRADFNSFHLARRRFIHRRTPTRRRAD